MAQLRQNFPSFEALKTVIVVVGPETATEFAEYWQKENLPFIGLPDPQHSVLTLYGQQFNLLRLGRMPAQLWIDVNGIVRLAHYGHSMRDIPSNKEVLSQIADIDRANLA